jgi:hypothetical protein
MGLVVWFLPVLIWGFFGILALQFRRRLPATPLRVLRARSPQRYYPLPIALIFLADGVAALIEDVRLGSFGPGVVYFLCVVPPAFWALDMFRFDNLLLSEEEFHQYTIVVRWEDVTEIRETWYGLSLRRRKGLSVPILAFMHTVSTEDVEFMRRRVEECSKASAA